MRGEAGTRLRWRGVGLWLALVAVVLKVAVPAGFMLAPDARNLIAITLCSGRGPVEAVVDLASGQIIEHGAAPIEDDSESTHDQPCSFAMAAAGAAPPSEPSIAAPIFFSSPAPLLATQLRPQINPTGPPLPARGPPLLA